MSLEEAGVKLVAEGAAAFQGDMKSATQATDTFVKTTEEGGGIVSKAGGMMGSAIKTVAGIAAGVGVAGFVALGKSIYDGIGAARESAKLNASTAQTIETMGNAAGRTVNDITDLATALSDASGKSLFGDDQIQQSENLLLTFGNIKGETFDLATALTVDLAQALGGAPADQAMMLGKALQDPIKGLTSLGKAGLTFSEEQKTMIASMVEAGDVAGAQGIILEELNKQVGGQAAAAAEADGGWTQFTATLGELEETVGAMLLPMLNDLVGVLNDKIVPVITDVVDAVGGVIEAFQDAGANSSEFAESLDYLGQKLGLPAGLIQDVVSATQDMVKWFDDGGASSADLGSELDDLNSIWEHVKDTVKNAADAYKDVIDSVLPQVQQFIHDHGDEIQAFFKETWDTINEIIHLALDIYNETVPPILHAVAGFIDEHGSEIQKILKGAWDAISEVIKGALETIKTTLKLALDLIHGDWDAAWKDIQHIGEVQWDAIKGALKGFLDAIAGIFDTSLNDIQQTWENNWTMLKEIAQKIDWSAIGSGIVAGIRDGISGAWNSFVDWVLGLLDGLKDQILEYFGIKSPSKLMADAVGEPIVQGIMIGIERQWDNLTNLVGSLSADLVDEMEDLGQKLQNAIADSFGATASFDRQIAKNFEEIGKVKDKFTQQILTQDLVTLQKKAQDLFADPKAQADYYKMVSAHEFETLKLREKIAAATTDEEKQRLNNQLVLISRAQDAELDQFYAKQQGKKSPMQQIADEFNEILKSLPTKLTDDQIKIVDFLGGIYGKLSNPPSTSVNPAYTGATSTYNSSTVNMPIYTNNTPAAMQQSWAVMNAGMI